MKTVVTSLESLTRELSVEVPITEFNQKVDELMRDLRSKVTIDGFRPGKVPLQIIKNKYGTSIKKDAVNEIVSQTLPKAFTQENLYPAGQPELTKMDFKDGETFNFTVTFEVFPEVVINDLSTLEVIQNTATITDADKDDKLKNLQKQLVTFNSVTRAAQTGDKVIINFEGFIDGEVFEGGKAEEFNLILGDNTMIAGFEDALIGKKANEDFEFDITFPQTYHVNHLAGKEVTFKINMITVNQPEYPEVNAEFAQKFGQESVANLLADMHKQMQLELDEKLIFINKNNVFDALLAAHKLEVPKVSVQTEAQNLLADMKQRMKEQNLPENDSMSAEVFTPEATKRIKLGLLVDKITTDNHIVANDEAINEKLVQMSQRFGDDSKDAQAMINNYKNNPDALKHIKSMLVEEKVSQFIANKAKVTVVDKSFTEIISS